MAIDYDALRTELTTDPLALGYADMDAEAARAAMAASTSAVEVYVSLKDLQSKLMETVVPPSPVPVWWALKSSAASNPLAEMAFDLFSSRLDNLNTRGAFQSAALAQLLSAGLIDQTLLDWINAKATVTKNRGEILFGRLPTVIEIQTARL